MQMKIKREETRHRMRLRLQSACCCGAMSEINWYKGVSRQYKAFLFLVCQIFNEIVALEKCVWAAVKIKSSL